jgi:cell division protein FtsZ
MREFDEVGRTIEEFASEDATVVIGTVLDHEMQDEVCVTVVATGLNRGVAARPQPRNERIEKVETPRLRPVAGLRDATTGMAIDPIAVPAPRAAARSEGRDATADLPMDYLDIPAFLRRQAD